MNSKPQAWPNFTVARDGTSIAYEDRGQGTPIIFTNGYATSHYYWEGVRAQLDPEYRTLIWDLKGHGYSAPARNLEECSIPACADDLMRVLDAAGVEKAVLAGFSLGCQIILETWREHPDRILAFVPVLGTYGRPFDNLLHPQFGKSAYRAFKAIGPKISRSIMPAVRLNMRLPTTHTVTRMTGMVGPDVDLAKMKPFYDHFQVLDGPSWIAMGVHAQDHSAEDLLESIDVPTLIVSGGRDVFTPHRLSVHMHKSIKGSELFLLPSATHAGLLEHTEAISARIGEFLHRNDLHVS